MAGWVKAAACRERETSPLEPSLAPGHRLQVVLAFQEVGAAPPAVKQSAFLSFFISLGLLPVVFGLVAFSLI